MKDSTKEIFQFLLLFLVMAKLKTKFAKENIPQIKKIHVVRRNQVYFSSSNVLTDTTVIVKD